MSPGETKLPHRLHSAIKPNRASDGADGYRTDVVRETETQRKQTAAHTDNQKPAAYASPASVVTAYLDAMETGDFVAARQWLARDFVMYFPEAPPMRSLQQLKSWANARYNNILKTRGPVEIIHSDHVAIVYLRGYLSGTWKEGSDFEGIRFIDRFEVSEGKLVRQDVWNDLGEVRPK